MVWIKYLLALSVLMSYSGYLVGQSEESTDKWDVAVGLGTMEPFNLMIEYNKEGSKSKFNPFISVEKGTDWRCLESGFTIVLDTIAFFSCLEDKEYDYLDVAFGYSIYSKDRTYSENGFVIQIGLKYRLAGKDKHFSMGIINNLEYKLFIWKSLYVKSGLQLDCSASYDYFDDAFKQFTIPDFDISAQIRVGFQF